MIQGKMSGPGIDQNQPEYIDSGLQIPIKIRADWKIGFHMEAATFEHKGEKYEVTSECGCGGMDALIVKVDGKTYTVTVNDFVEAVMKHTKGEEDESGEQGESEQES